MRPLPTKPFLLLKVRSRKFSAGSILAFKFQANAD